MSERTEIENAIYRWAWAYDESDLESFVDSVHQDIDFKVEVANGSVVELKGRDKIREFFGGRLAKRTERRRHVTTNVIIDEETANEARTRSILTLIQYRDGRPELVSTGWYKDRVVRDGDVWRIRERHAYLEIEELPAP